LKSSDSTSNNLGRRELLRILGAAGASTLLPGSILSPLDALAAQHAPGIRPDPSMQITTQQDAFLDDLQRRGCLYFWEQASAKTGQVKDRARAEGRDSRRVASTAATGFGLTALCIAHKRGYLPAGDVVQRVLTTLQFHLERMPQDHGFLFHFADMDTGQRAFNCEVSSMDTAILLCGALTCRAYFKGRGPEAQIRDLATKLYERVDFPWMLNGGTTFSMGVLPEHGFLNARWSTYCELMVLYLLAIGSPTHPIAPTYWQHFARPYINFQDFRYVSDLAPLFIHQYSHAWFDFRHKRDRYIDYYANSVTATQAHKAFCIAQGFAYSEVNWGVTSSDSVDGYIAWGGPPLLRKIDGTIVPSACAGSLPFAAQDCLHVLMNLREKYDKQAYGRYGFVDAMHPEINWYNPDILGIDQGIGVLMAENLRSQFVWQTFMDNPEAARAMKLCGFHAT
jgi:hypothetical protein